MALHELSIFLARLHSAKRQLPRLHIITGRLILAIPLTCVLLIVVSCFNSYKPERESAEKALNKVISRSDRFFVTREGKLIAVSFDGFKWSENVIFEEPSGLKLSSGMGNVPTVNSSYDGTTLEISLNPDDAFQTSWTDFVYFLDCASGDLQCLPLTFGHSSVQWVNPDVVAVGGFASAEWDPYSTINMFAVARRESEGRWNWAGHPLLGILRAVIGDDLYAYRCENKENCLKEIKELRVFTPDGKVAPVKEIDGVSITNQNFTSNYDGYVIVRHGEEDKSSAAVYCSWNGKLVVDGLPKRILFPMDTPDGPSFLLPEKDDKGNWVWSLIYWNYNKTHLKIPFPENYYIIGYSYIAGGWWFVRDSELYMGEWKTGYYSTSGDSKLTLTRMYKPAAFKDYYTEEYILKRASREKNESLIAESFKYSAGYRIKPSMLTIMLEQPKYSQ
jgi:hypothetical protein